MDNNTDYVPAAVLTQSSPHYATSGKIMLTCVIVLVTLIILMLILHIYIRWHLHQRRNQYSQRPYHRRSHNLNFASISTVLSNSTRKSLDPSILNSLPVFVYKNSDELVECAVCLCEFEDEEKGRTLTACKHRFHVECIDMWFGSHSTCPVCRMTVELIKKDEDLGESTVSS